MAKIRKQEALDYHENGRPGKIEVVPTKPYHTQRDLSLAYSPGVAEPCLEIAKNKDDVYNTLTTDLYYLGSVLNAKYRLLRMTYYIFMIGIIVSVLAFSIAFIYRNTITM